MATSERGSSGLPVPKRLLMAQDLHIPSAFRPDLEENQLGSLKFQCHGAQYDEIKHVEHQNKTRMPILIPGANNSTSREKFSAQAIFSYHGFCWLWQHICLKVYVMPGELRVLLNRTIRNGHQRSSGAKTNPRGSGTSHTLRFLTRSRRKPSGVT